MVLWRPTRPFRTNTHKRCPFPSRGLECKSRKSRDTWSNRQTWPWCTEWSRAKANRVLPRERTGHSKHPLPTTQEKTLHMDITRWSTLKSEDRQQLTWKVVKLAQVWIWVCAVERILYHGHGWPLVLFSACEWGWRMGELFLQDWDKCSLQLQAVLGLLCPHLHPGYFLKLSDHKKSF